MEDRGAQLGHCRGGAEGLSNVKRMSQIELARCVSTMCLKARAASDTASTNAFEAAISRACSGRCGFLCSTATRCKLKPQHRVGGRRLYPNRRREPVEESSAFLALCQIEWPHGSLCPE